MIDIPSISSLTQRPQHTTSEEETLSSKDQQVNQIASKTLSDVPIITRKDETPHLDCSLTGIYRSISQHGQKLLGRLWLPQYAGPIYPGVIAHKSASSWSSTIFGQPLTIFQKSVGVLQNYDEGRIIQDASIRNFAEKNGGICTFWIKGMIPVIYITDYDKSLQILDDTFSRIPLNESLSGVSDLDSQELLTTQNRNAALGHLLGPQNLLECINKATKAADEFLMNSLDDPKDLSHFLHAYTECAESKALFAFDQKPLSEYTKIAENHQLLHEFLEKIIDIEMHQSMQSSLGKKYEQFMLDILNDNFESISKDSPNNLFKKMYESRKLKFPQTKEEIGKQGEVELKTLKQCFGIIAGASVNTSNAVNWVVRHIENNPGIKEKIIREAQSASFDFKSFSDVETNLPYIQSVVLESLRFTPIVPGLGKLVRKPHTIKIDGQEIYLNTNTLILLDILTCNRTSKNHFSNPSAFDVININENKKSLSSFLNGKASFRSFGGGHNAKATSKCPGRFFTISLQTLLVARLYKNFVVRSENVSLKGQNWAASQFHLLPEDKGTITIQM